MSVVGFQKGFTLIELIVVVSIISLMLFFTLPNLRGTLQPQSARDTTRWIMNAEKKLRENAIRHNIRYTLHVDLTAGKIWFSNELMEAEEIERFAAKAVSLSENVVISEIAFPLKNKTVHGSAEIHFYPKGYADKTVIRIHNDRDNKFNLLIEPFLSGVRIVP